MRRIITSAAIAVILSGCGLTELVRPCSSSHPCDARPVAYKREERKAAKKSKLDNGTVVFMWNDDCRFPAGIAAGTPCLVTYVVAHGKLVRVKAESKPKR